MLWGVILFSFVDTHLCCFLFLYSTTHHSLSSISFYYLANERNEEDTKMKEDTKVKEDTKMKEEGGDEEREGR